MTGSSPDGYEIIDARDLARFERGPYARNTPAVLRGLREAYPGLRIFDWSAAYFTDVLGDRPVPVLTTHTGFLSYERDTRSMPFREFTERTFGTDGRATSERLYFKNPTKLLPEGHDDSDRIDGLAPYLKRAVARNLWISGPGLTVGLHFDQAENLNFALRGRKRFVCYPPGVRAYYPLSMFSQTAHISGVFREGPNPDLRRFPRFDPSRAVDIELCEGDVLYLPAYWWHQVISLGDENVNFNCWWLPRARKQVRHWNQALRGYVQMGLRFAKFGDLQKAPGKNA